MLRLAPDLQPRVFHLGAFPEKPLDNRLTCRPGELALSPPDRPGHWSLAHFRRPSHSRCFRLRRINCRANTNLTACQVELRTSFFTSPVIDLTTTGCSLRFFTSISRGILSSRLSEQATGRGAARIILCSRVPARRLNTLTGAARWCWHVGPRGSARVGLGVAGSRDQGGKRSHDTGSTHPKDR